MDAAKREDNNCIINNAINQLTNEVVLLENLLGEIQGQPNQPEIANDKVDQAVPSIMETLNGTAGRIYKLSERVAIARNTIRESLF